MQGGQVVVQFYMFNLNILYGSIIWSTNSFFFSLDQWLGVQVKCQPSGKSMWGRQAEVLPWWISWSPVKAHKERQWSGVYHWSLQFHLSVNSSAPLSTRSQEQCYSLYDPSLTLAQIGALPYQQWPCSQAEREFFCWFKSVKSFGSWASPSLHITHSMD